MARVILGTSLRTPTQNNLNALKWVPIQDRWNYFKCKMIFSAFLNQNPAYILNMFQQSHTVHNIRTRSAQSTGLILPKVRTEMGKQSFSFTGASIWNNLPYFLRNAQSDSSFSLLFWHYNSLNQ